MKHLNAALVAFGLVIFAALAETRSCSPTTPPVWPAQFTIHQAKWGATGNSSVVTYYDWDAQVNLLIDTPDGDQHNPLWDLELGNGNSYYSHVCAPRHVLMLSTTPCA